MRIAVITFWMLFAATNVSAEYFNQRNIIEECSKDSSFGSTCHTYLAAYRDFMTFMVFAPDGEAAYQFYWWEPHLFSGFYYQL